MELTGSWFTRAAPVVRFFCFAARRTDLLPGRKSFDRETNETREKRNHGRRQQPRSTCSSNPASRKT
jgi:hypothetical protein